MNTQPRRLRRSTIGTPCILICLAVSTTLTHGCATDPEAHGWTPASRAASLRLPDACDDTLPADEAAWPLVVEHPGIQVGDLWTLRRDPATPYAQLLDGDTPAQALLSNTHASTTFQLRCLTAGPVWLGVYDEAGALRGELGFDCVRPRAYAEQCAVSPPPPRPAPEPDAATPPADLPGPDAGAPDQGSPPDIVEPTLRLRVDRTRPIRLSWPGHPVDDAPTHVDLPVQVTQAGSPVAQAWVGRPSRSPAAPFAVEALGPTDAEGRAVVRVRPRAWRGDGVLRLVARVDRAASPAAPGIPVQVLSTPVSQLALTCASPLRPALGPRGDHGHPTVAGVTNPCQVRATDNRGRPVPQAEVRLRAEAGQVPATVTTGADGVAAFTWRSEGPGPFVAGDGPHVADAQVALLAATPGMEGFENGDPDPGSFQPGWDRQTPAQDRGEPFLDLDGDGRWSPALRGSPGQPDAEPFLDADGDGRRDPSDGEWSADALVWDTVEVIWHGPPAHAELDVGARRRPDGRYDLGGFAIRAEIELRLTDAQGLCAYGVARLTPSGMSLDPDQRLLDLADLCGPAGAPLPLRFDVLRQVQAPAHRLLIELLSDPADAAPTFTFELEFTTEPG